MVILESKNKNSLYSFEIILCGNDLDVLIIHSIFFISILFILKKINDNRLLYQTPAGSAGGSPASKRHACIKCLKLKLYLNFPPFCLSWGQMRASRPRSREACLKTVANHFLSFRNLNSISKLFLPPPQRGKVRMGGEKLIV